MAEQKGVFFDDEQFPLVYVAWNGVGDDRNFDDYMAFLDRTLVRAVRERARVAWIFDARRSGFTPPVQRQRQADWIRNNFEGARATCAGFAFVIDSAMIRGMLTAVLWFAPMPAPHTVVPTVNDARLWCAARLKDWGVALSV